MKILLSGIKLLLRELQLLQTKSFYSTEMQVIGEYNTTLAQYLK